MNDQHLWPGLKSISMVVSTRIFKNKTTTEKRYYISSCQADAKLIGDCARKHWSIENKLHWRLDVVFNEDKACIRNENAVQNMALLRKWSLNLLSPLKGKSSIKSLQRKASMSWTFMRNILSTTFHA